ncbi:hypothetical protein [Deinococcus depolymerans]|uniref:hypothetical protein n=1 Tax=Deinococcus depolymerans TaxID=392408 RepID=UPI0031DEF98A
MEWVINFTFSTSPLWLGTLALAAIDKSDNHLFSNYISKFPNLYQKGELFSYSIAALAPVIYIAIKLRKEEKYSDKAIGLLLLSILFAIISSVLIATSLSNSNFNGQSTLSLSITVFWVCFALLFIAIFINNQASPESQMIDANDVIATEGQNFASRFRDR